MQSTGYSFASLKVDALKKVIRIVNPTEFKLRFNIESKSGIHSTPYDITPRAGVLPPRSCTLIIIKINDGLKRSNLLGDLNLIYWSGTKGRRFKGYVLIKLDKAEDVEVAIASTYLFLRIVKSLFLAGLIFYNIILIKTILSG